MWKNEQIERAIMGIDKERHGLYHFTSEAIQKSNFKDKFTFPSHLFRLDRLHFCSTTFPGKSVDVDIWHKRLGHMFISRMQLLLFLPKNDSLSHCSIFSVSKQSRLVFPRASISKSFSAFQLIHMDIWGPFHTPTYNGDRYFLTIVDDFSRETWIYLMQSKTDVQRLIRLFFAMVDNQFSKKIQAIRTDNSTNFFKSECQLFFSSLGVVHHGSYPYTPQQNGIVERKHIHILDVARALRFQSSIPLKYLGDCVLTVVYLINRAPTTMLDNKIHFELLFQEAPSLANLRVFGCLCYASVLSIGHKFSPCAVPCALLGYSSVQKGYKLLNL